MRSELGWKWIARKTKCCTRIMWIYCLEAPREAGWSLYRELERWTLFMWKGFGEEMGWKQERGSKKETISLVLHVVVSFLQSRRKRTKSVWNGVFGLDPLVNNSSGVSTSCRGQTETRSVLNILPGPDQADGSGIQLLEWGPGRDGIKSRAGWMDDWQTGIFYCKSPLIEQGVICWLSEMKLSLFCMRDERTSFQM